METLLPFEKIEHEVLVKKEAETSDKFGLYPNQRSVPELINYGVVNIDKPKGPTSHQVSSYTQNILKLKKGGHAGTLDPKVTGILAVALGDATRIVQALLPAGKEYICLMHLHKEIDEYDIRKVCAEFVGKIRQLPPIKSAVKREWRYRKIYYLKIHDVIDQDVLFLVGCQAGTYIRKLCLHPHTEILSKNGLILASDFNSNPQTIYSFDKGKMIEKNPSATQKLHSPTKLIKITMASGINFIVTQDHELFYSSPEGYKMIEARKLKKGNYLVKSIKFPAITKEYVVSDLLDDKFLISQENIKERCKRAFIKKYGSIRAMNRKLKLDRKAFLSGSQNAITIKHLKLAGIYEKIKSKINIFKTEKGTTIKLEKLNKGSFYLLGLIASDGNNTKEKNTIRYTRLKFHNKNEVLIDKFLSQYKKLFPNVPISKKKIKDNFFQLDTSNSFFATIAASLGVKSPQKNSDIELILYCKPEFIKAFLRGYFDGDGTCYFKKKERIKGHYTNIRLFSVSYIAIKRLHQMLLKLNIPNKIFSKKDMYVISLESLASKHKFIKEIGSHHPRKIKILNRISKLKKEGEIGSHYLIGLHYKEEIRKNKKKLHKMGGNLNRVLKGNMPITRKFYIRSSTITKLPMLDNFIIEKIASINYVQGSDYVYDMTVPKTHNFLIETGFVSSNCHDIGQKLGCGAHMAELRRTKAGPFNESTALTSLHDLQDAFHYYETENNEEEIRKVVLPMEFAVSHLPQIWVLDTTVNALCNGADLAVPGIAKLHSEIQVDELVAIKTLKGELIAIGKAKMISNDIIKKARGIAVKTDKVFMKPGIYPKVGPNK